jgi:hypothetical protein
MPAAVSSARPATATAAKKRGKAKEMKGVPNCASFEGQVLTLAPGHVTGPGVTELGGSHSLCSWSGQPSGQYAFVVTVAVFPAPSFVAKALLKQAKDAEIAADHKPGGFGEYVTGNARRGRFFEGMAVWGEEAPNKETGKCPTEVNAEGIESQNLAIEPNQTGPSCAGQPGTEGDYATAYGSARRSTAPIIVQISVACQLDTSGGPLRLARAEIAGFSRKY